MPNVPLQQRAGLNIGVESLPPFIQAGAMPELAIPAPSNTSDTVIMEGREDAARTPLVRAGISPASGNFGFLYNPTADTYSYEVFFKDEDDNELSLSVAATVNPASIALLNITKPLVGGGTDMAAFALCPREKLILRLTKEVQVG